MPFFAPHRRLVHAGVAVSLPLWLLSGCDSLLPSRYTEQALRPSCQACR